MPATRQKEVKTSRKPQKSITKDNKKVEDFGDSGLEATFNSEKSTFLNLSENSNGDEVSKTEYNTQTFSPTFTQDCYPSGSRTDFGTGYHNAWSENIPKDSEEMARKTFKELEQNKAMIAQIKTLVMNLEKKQSGQEDKLDVKDLLAQGENDLHCQTALKRFGNVADVAGESDADDEDWEAVNESKPIPQQGLQLLVDFPTTCKKTKKLGVEKMLKRKINKARKENQVNMHKVHLLCLLAHGNYVSKILNDYEILAIALSLVPSKFCSNEFNLKNIEEMLKWYKEVFKLKQEEDEQIGVVNTSLKEHLLKQIINQTVTDKTYSVFIFVSILRAIGFQIRLMFNFVPIPVKLPNSELFSIHKKSEDEKKTILDNECEQNVHGGIKEEKSQQTNIKAKRCKNTNNKRTKNKTKGTSQIEDNSNYYSDQDNENIMQLDGNDDNTMIKNNKTKSNKKENILNNKKIKSDTLLLSKITLCNPKTEEKSKTETTSKAETKINKQQIKQIAITEEQVTTERTILHENSKTQKHVTFANTDESIINSAELLTVVRRMTKTSPNNKSKSTHSNDRTPPEILVSGQKCITDPNPNSSKISTRKCTRTTNTPDLQNTDNKITQKKIRTKSASGSIIKISKYFDNKDSKQNELLHRSPQAYGKVKKRILTNLDETSVIKNDTWCEVFVEELEQWIAVDVLNAKINCANDIYNQLTRPVSYIVEWDNDNYLKDLTSRYVPVPIWNTETRKRRIESAWWEESMKPWIGPKITRDMKEDEHLRNVQLEAPLPKSIAEYKNHPLYVLKRHILKYQALYPPEPATLGFVRGEAVYPRACLFTCGSRETWLKDAKMVRAGELPYKIVNAKPKFDRLANKYVIRPLEIFGPWQVQEYEPTAAENGKVPRNAYGNVELFKSCMLPKGTVHIKLPGLNKVARKLNIDCAPAMTGYDFNRGFTHPIFDGFVVCQEFEKIITQAWIKDQEDQKRRERERIETRVYGNWKRLIKGLLIRDRLKCKYGFDHAAPSPSKNISKIANKRR